MKKNVAMTSAMAAALVALPGCSDRNNGWNDDVIASSDTAICVDREGRRIDDDLCDDDRNSGVSSAFLWYYIGRSSAIPYYGDSIHNRRYRGSFTPAAGAFYSRAPASTRMTRSQAVSRGGLGSSSRRYGGGRS